MYIYVFTYICAFVYISTYVFTYIHVCTYIYICTQTCTYTFTLILLIHPYMHRRHANYSHGTQSNAEIQEESHIHQRFWFKVWQVRPRCPGQSWSLMPTCILIHVSIIYVFFCSSICVFIYVSMYMLIYLSIYLLCT